jgi:hypothetical protein
LVEDIRLEFHRKIESLWLSTASCCEFALQGGTADPEQAELKASLIPSAVRAFEDLIKCGTAPATLKAYSFLYIETLSAQVKTSFVKLLQVASISSEGFRYDPIEWAAWQVEDMIDSAILAFPFPFFGWLEACFDRTLFSDPLGMDWCAPRLVVMQPLGNTPFVESTAWERLDRWESYRQVQKFGTTLIWNLKRVLEQCKRASGSGAPSETASKPIQHRESIISADDQHAEKLNNAEGRRHTLLNRAETAEGWFRTEEAAMVLRVSARTINRWAKSRKLQSGPKRGTVTTISVKQLLTQPN